MTSGETLKRQLGLQQLMYVRIGRVIGTPQPIYIIWYDSRSPRFPVTTALILRKPTVSAIHSGSQQPVTELRTTPPILIEEFNGVMRGSLFLTVDLAGHQLIDGRYLEAAPTSYVARLPEFLTMKDLRQGVSAFTKRTRQQRNRVQGTENRLASLADVDINQEQDHVTFYFITEPTTGIYPDDYEFGEVDPDADFRIMPNRGRTYTMQIRVLEFFAWLDTAPDMTELTRQNLVEIFEVSNIQVFSDAPSFHWQGPNFFASQLDASIYPTDIEPKRWNQSHLHGAGPYVVDKHLAGLINQMGFFYQQMASMLTTRLRDRRII